MSNAGKPSLSTPNNPPRRLSRRKPPPNSHAGSPARYRPSHSFALSCVTAARGCDVSAGVLLSREKFVPLGPRSRDRDRPRMRAMRLRIRMGRPRAHLRQSGRPRHQCAVGRDRRSTVPMAPCWTDSDRLLIRMVDELHDSGRLSDELWTVDGRAMDSRTAPQPDGPDGWYHLISFVANAARVPLEEFGARFPARDRAE